MAKRATIYVAQPVQDALDAVSAGQDGSPYSVSGRIASICERYDIITRTSVPRNLTLKEWVFCFSVLGAESLNNPSHVAYALKNHCQQSNDFDADALAAKIGEWPIGSGAAVLELFERFEMCSDPKSVENFLERQGFEVAH
jgi:hypothetical protein